MIKEEIKKREGLMVPIRYDEVFKEVFGNEDYPNITAFLMSKLLNIPYEVIKDHVLFIQKGQKNRKVLEKNSEKDIVFLIDFERPMKINLEANINPSKKQTIIDRNLYYFSNLFGNSLGQGEDYTKIKTTIQYNFNTFYVDQIHAELIDEYSLNNKYGYNLSEKIKIVHINIEEMAKLWYNKKYKKYDEELRQIICIGALMMINSKEDFRECLSEIKANSSVIIDIERLTIKSQ